MVIIGMQTKKKSEEQMEELAAFSGRFLDTSTRARHVEIIRKSEAAKAYNSNE